MPTVYEQLRTKIQLDNHDSKRLFEATERFCNSSRKMMKAIDKPKLTSTRKHFSKKASI